MTSLLVQNKTPGRGLEFPAVKIPVHTISIPTDPQGEQQTLPLPL